MTSINNKIDTVKAAVSSTNTCTSATTVILRELLIPEAASASTVTGTSTKQATKRVPASSRARAKTDAAKPESQTSSKNGGLSAKDKEVLATHVINAALKALNEAAKTSPPPQTPMRTEVAPTPRKTGSGTLRRSLSTPLSPLQPRTLNRTATTIEHPPSKSTRCPAHSVSATCLALVECARVAFQALRVLNGPDAPSQKNMQLEMGILAFIGKLLALGLQEHALKELRILKKRLEERAIAGNAKKGTKAGTTSADASISSARVLSDLLDFKESVVTPSTRGLVISTQLYVLRLMMLNKKPEQIEAATPFLRESNRCAPLNLLLASLRDDPKEAAKIARQIESLASIILSLAPSPSNRDDAEAMEPRLNPSPLCAFELQAVALKTKLHFWKIAKRSGDAEKEILTPFSRYVAALSRRLKPVSAEAHEISQTAFLDLQAMLKEQRLTWPETSRSPVAAVYQSLGSAALSLKRPSEARDWTEKLYELLDVEKDSAARRCSVAAQLLAVCLKCKLDEAKLLALLTETIEGMQGTLRGESAELDQLLIDLSLARRSAVGLLMNASEHKSKISATLTDLLQTFIIQYPRFTMRWLGKAPSREGGADTKDFLRFETRKQAVQGSLGQMLDSTLVVIKALLSSNKVDWTKPDSVLQDCLELLDRMGDLKGSLNGSNGSTYYVKISNLYYMKYALLRQSSESSDDVTPLRSLRRSLDAIRNRSPKEKETGQFVTKLERFADICTKFRRIDEARESLKSICTTMVEQGVLSEVASLLNKQPPSMAWSANEKSALFSRTLRSIAKLDKSWNDWTFFMPEVERAAVLEHIVHVITSGENTKIKEPLKLTDAPVDSLLRIYSLEKFPIRRLRTLLHLYSMHIANPDHSPSLRTQVDAAVQAASSKSVGEDGGLTRYLPHLTAYLSSIASLTRWTPNSPDLNAAVSYWHGVVSNSKSKEDILGRIDDPALLTTHLKAVADLASMKGENSLVISVLELLADLAKKLEEAALDEVVANASLLATQYASLGYSDKAEAIIDATKVIAEQTDRLSGTTVADFHLAVADYCITTGSFEKA
ncbi:hypothetical protein jhhlp_000872 [Lomentospora prolificans]|uniref:Separase n=1 Tax=Lomentospora prolificans TaxID=41688 RepID=A0A2N3NJR5_9PEZI|nr:hypothetical protein jhhlp_000872 [Lomentospora prolificans]